MARSVWVNLLGQWQDITETGTVEGLHPLEYASLRLGEEGSPEFVQVEVNDVSTLIHHSQIQVESHP